MLTCLFRHAKHYKMQKRKKKKVFHNTFFLINKLRACLVDYNRCYNVIVIPMI